MTQQENEIAETTETEGNILERAMETVEEVAETPATESLLKTAPAALNEWVSETREVMQRHWGQALERARTRLEPVAKVAIAEEAEQVANEEEPVAPTPLHSLLGSAIVTRAQERGAAILLGSMRKLRAQLEQLEANLEAARPTAAA